MSSFDLSLSDLWEWSFQIFFYVYVVLWILVAYLTHTKSHRKGNRFSGLGPVVFFGFIIFFMLLQVLELLKDKFHVQNMGSSIVPPNRLNGEVELANPLTLDPESGKYWFIINLNQRIGHEIVDCFIHIIFFGFISMYLY